MMMRTLALWLIVIGVQAQEVVLTGLKPGDPFPGHKIANVIHHKSSTLDIAAYRGKLVILDLWATTCTACVGAWPKLLELQQQFKDQLQIVLINKFEDESVVRPFLSRRKRLTQVDMNLPNSCNDPVMRRLFPENGVPRYVWIDAEGVVRSVTYGDQVTADNITRWLKDGPQPLPQIVDDWVFPDVSKPLFVDGNGGPGHAGDFIWSSTLTRGSRNIPGGIDIAASPGRGYYITSTGASIESLYRVAYYDHNEDSAAIASFLPASRMNLEAIAQSGESYNYQLLSGRAVSRQQLLGYMRMDLQRYFGYSGQWTNQTKKCLVMKMGSVEKAKYKGGTRDLYLSDTEVIFDSVSVRQAIRFMEEASRYFYSPYPIVDETHFEGLLGIRSECNCSEPEQLDKALTRHGLRLLIEEREVPVLTLRRNDDAH